MRIACDAGGEGGADGVQHARGKLAGAIEEGGIVVRGGLARDADVQAGEGKQRQTDAFGLAEERQVALCLEGAGGIERAERGAGGQNGLRGGRRFGGGGTGGSAARQFGIEEGECAALGEVAPHGPQGHGEDGLQHAARQGQQARRERLAEGRRGRRGEDDQGNQGDTADIAWGWAGGHHQSGGKGAGGFEQRSQQVVAPEKASREYREGHTEGGAENPASAVQVGVGAIGEGDVERASGCHGATRDIAQRDAGGEREGHAEGVAQGHRGLELRAIETRDGGPEGGRQAITG